jgi:purine-binding chemotaxis protein CheW
MKELAVRHAALASPRTDYLCVSLAGDEYAVRLDRVTEILRPTPITEVPGAPEGVFGIASARGRLITVIDARRRLGLATATLDRRSRILMMESEDREVVGLLVDHVKQVRRLSDARIEPTTVLGAEPNSAVVGIARPESGRADGELVVVLDADELARVGG